MRFKLVILLLIIPLFLLSITVKIEEPRLENDHLKNELPTILTPGLPEITYIPIKILLPMGEKLTSIEVNFLKEAEIIENIYIDYVRAMQPVSGEFFVETQINYDVYNNNKLFPYIDFELLDTQRIKGYDIALVNLYPYKYNPVENKLLWFKEVEINFTSEYDENIFKQQNRFLITNSKTREKILSFVQNPELISTYQKQSVFRNRELPDEDDPYCMIIITDDEREPFFEEFVTWKDEQDIKTGVFLTSEIYEAYEGNDEQDKIRNFIIDAFETYSGTDIPLEYVFLGGDDEIIPIRRVYIQVWGTVDWAMPCDLYYSNLDGDWDANDNLVYGEVADNVDMYPELAVGRIPAETEEEFQNFFNKNYSYVDIPSVSDDIAYMLGENLNNNPLTWGGDYKDEIAPIIEEGIHIFRLYDMYGTFSSQAVEDAINFGVSILNHMGHSNETMVFGQNGTMAHSYTNTEYGFAYSQGCYPAAFDELTSGPGESVGENLVIASGGLYAFVGNTRYGWYSPGSTNGPSQPFDIAFFEAIYEQGLRELGNALQYSREVMVNQALTSNVMRWVFYELVLFGDPSISVKEANGNFPFIQPVSSIYDDSQGDGDGIANPGETINIYITLENLEGWADAQDVYAKIFFDDETIEILQDSVYYGYIAGGATSISGAFVVNVPQDCNYDVYEYTIQVVAPVTRTTYFNKSYTLSFEVSLFQSNWPWDSPNSFVSNPIISDFNNDDQKEILAIDILTNVHLLTSEANEFPGFPWIFNEDIWRSTALGDIDQDGLDDIVVASKTGKVYALDNEGNQIFEYENCMQQILTPIISDVNGDGVPEIISFGLDKNLLVLDNDGNLIDGYPIEFSHLCVADMASADLNQDGAYEVIIGSQNGCLYALDGNGENIEGFPVDLSSSIYAAPAVLDNYKIALGTDDSKLHIISNTGEILITKDLDSKIASSVILGDFDNDNELEIAFNTINGGIYIVDQNGIDLPGWPVFTGKQFIDPPLAADINNDENVDILCLTNMNELYVFNFDGSEFAFSPVPVRLSGTTPASIDDIDADRDYEIISGTSRGLFVLDIKLTKGNKIPWRTYRGNYKRTGSYEDNNISDIDESTTFPVITKLCQNYPNPFNPVGTGRNSGTTIKFTINRSSASDGELKNVKIKIYNIRGQEIKTFNVSMSQQQQYSTGSGLIEASVTWNGKDKNGKNVSSGIYLYNLTIDDKFIDAKKCVLLK